MIIIVYESDCSILPEQSSDSLSIKSFLFIKLFSNSPQKDIVKDQLDALEKLLPGDSENRNVIWLIPGSLKQDCLQHLKRLSHDFSLSWQNSDENIL